MQKWKTDPTLHSCDRKNNKKCLDYDVYKDEFLENDPIQDWPSFKRCQSLWRFFNSVKPKKFKKKNILLDIGTKDGQFPEWINETIGDSFKATGIEISDEYVKYAQEKRRPVEKGDICNLQYKDRSVDIVFTHHCLGLCPDYKKGIEESMRVLKKFGYFITCNSVPGNKKKHYDYIESPETYKEWLKNFPKHKVVYFDYWKPKEFPDEFVMILQKL